MSETNKFNTTLDKFHEYLLSILKLYNGAIPVLKDELDAILEDDIQALNDSLKSQQALFLKTKYFDKSITGYLSELNISAKNISEMASKLPAEHQLRFYDLIEQFGRAIEEVKFYREKCRAMLQTKLYHLDRSLTTQNIQKDNTTYNSNASEVHGTLFPKSFETTI